MSLRNLQICHNKVGTVIYILKQHTHIQTIIIAFTESQKSVKKFILVAKIVQLYFCFVIRVICHLVTGIK